MDQPDLEPNEDGRLQALGRFAAGVSHDLNNLIFVINGNIELIRHFQGPETSSTDPLQVGIGQIEEAARQTGELANKLMLFAGRGRRKVELISLKKLVQDSHRMLQRLVKEDVTIELGNTESNDISLIRADSTQLMQVLLQLVLNADKAINESGTILIEINNTILSPEATENRSGVDPGDFVHLKVVDHGSGFSEENRARMFDPYFASADAGDSSGLGLSIVHGIVRQTNGFLQCRNGKEGGTIIDIFFPAEQPKSGEKIDETPIPGQSKADASAGAQTILVCDDDEFVRELTTRILHSAGYAVHSAENAREALELIREQKGDIDLLLTDIIMPGMNGRELSRRMQEEFPSVKVLLMSGYTANTLEENGALSAKAEFLQKPISSQTLLQSIQVELGKKDQE